MSELRYDPLSGHWITIASIRAARPNEFRRLESRIPDAVCPFCAGQESQTPHSILEWRGDSTRAPASPTDRDAAAWLVRVVPNKYPAYSPGGTLSQSLQGPYASLQGEGSHEIVIESPRHAISLSELTDDELRLSFRAYQSRIRAAMQNELIRQVTLFKNCRPEAGASIEHVHSQIIASPVVALSATSRFERCIRAYCDSGSSLLSALVRWEERQGDRVLESRDEYLAFCPFASRFAFQIWIAGREQTTPFEDLTANALDRLADLVRRCVTKLEIALHNPPYNLILHLPPKLKSDYPLADIFPWFIEIIPRLGRLAGFELAGGGWILDCLPETAAERIRSATSAEQGVE